MSARITQQDIAKAAGRSLKTVALALSDSPRVSTETKESIRQIADELGYLHARSQTGRIGLIAPGFVDNNADILESIHHHVSTLAGFSIEYQLTGGNVGAELNAIIELDQSQPEGIILISPRTSESRLAPYLSRQRPILAINASFEEKPGLAAILLDNEGSAAQLISMLVGKGHRDFAYLAGPTSNSEARRRGCEFALREAGLPQMMVYGAKADQHQSMTAGYLACGELLQTHVEHPPTAVIGYTDSYAIGALARLKETNLRVPDDISVAAFGDSEGARYSDPPLTTVNLSRSELGEAAVGKLLQMMGVRSEAPTIERLPAYIMERASTGPVKT